MININKIALLAKLKGKIIACYTCNQNNQDYCHGPTFIIQWEENGLCTKKWITKAQCYTTPCRKCIIKTTVRDCFEMCEHWEEK